MNISAGRLRGRRLTIPAGARPSSGRLREALFSIWGDRVEGSRFLDLFAGSGGVGIEAWSRGAAEVTLVDSDRRSLTALRRNVALVDEVATTRILGVPVQRALERLKAEGKRFDLIFADPPYALRLGAPFFAGVLQVVAADGALAVERRSGDLDGADFTGWRREPLRRYGDSALDLYLPIEE